MEIMTDNREKTSLNIDPEFWRAWRKYTVNKTGSMKKLSEETRKALEEYMKNHPLEE
jgi:hypothetical protein